VGLNKTDGKSSKNRIIINMKQLKLLVIAAAMVITVQARASLYNITFTDGGANEANGQIDVVGGVAVSGFLNVTAGITLGIWNLYSGGPTPFYSPSGAFIVDNVVNPSLIPFLTNNGLLFTSGGYELNLFGNSGPNDYSFYANLSGYNPAIGLPFNTLPGTATISAAVPEPTTVIAGALMLLPFGIGVIRSLRKDRTA
jgi:hypothetical protein